MQKALEYQNLRNVQLHIEDGIRKLKMPLNMVILMVQLKVSTIKSKY